MKTRKLRLVSALLAVAMMLALLPTAAFAADGEPATSGTCGAKGNENSVHWTLDSDGTLTISGSGAMKNYDYNRDNNTTTTPWDSKRGEITKAVIEGGVTSIGDNVFSGCANLESVDLSKASSLKTIGSSFYDCTKLDGVELYEGLETIGGSAFNHCTSLGSIHIPSTVTEIGSWCFESCTSLSKVTFAAGSQLTTIQGAAFIYCGNLKTITIPKSVKEIQAYENENGYKYGTFSGLKSVIFEPDSELETVDEYAFRYCNNLTIYCSDEDTKVKEALKGKRNTGNIRSLTPTVTFEVDGTVFAKQNAKENHFKAAKPEPPTKKGYVFTGWYTKNADNEYKPFDFNTTVTENITLYAQWEKLPDHQLTVIGGTFAVKDETIKTETKDDAVIANIPVDAEVTVAFNKEAYADSNQTFDGWVIEGLDDAENYTHQETFTFTMPQNGVRIEAMTKVVNVDDSGWDAATVVTGAVIGTGTAILAYHIGMEVYAEQVLGKDVAVPRTRGEVALLAWQLAGSPEPNAAFELLTDEAKAQQWAVESGLLQLDAEGNFHAEKKLSKLKALRVLDAAKKQG